MDNLLSRLEERITLSEKEMSRSQKLHLKDALSVAERRGVHSLTTKKAGDALQFHTKREAASFAKLVGWRASDVIRKDIMVFIIWVISDPHLNFLTARGALRSLAQKGIDPYV